MTEVTLHVTIIGCTPPVFNLFPVALIVVSVIDNIEEAISLLYANLPEWYFSLVLALTLMKRIVLRAIAMVSLDRSIRFMYLLI